MTAHRPLILVINPGSTSTKIALYDGEQVRRQTELTHPADELTTFKNSLEQLDYRLAAVITALRDWQVEPADLDAVIGRGGPLKPLAGGVYRVGQALLDDLGSGRLVDHASTLGGLVACRLAEAHGRPAFIADPVSVDEFEDVARLSGHPELPRLSRTHALNIKAVVRQAAADLGRKPEELDFIVVHLGGGISVAAHRHGRLIDANDASDGGPFSPERVGTLPLTGLLKLCFSGRYTLPELTRQMLRKGGLTAHLGTPDVREIERRILAGDRQAELVLRAMAYQVAKEIGAMAAVLCGRVDAIILTGGIAHNTRVVEWIRERVAFIAPLILKPGQNEMAALAAHAVAALREPGIVKEYR